MSKYNEYASELYSMRHEMQMAIENKDFDKYERLEESARSLFEKIKHESELDYDYTNFGMMNHVFEEVLPMLYVKNKKAVKEYVNTIRGDKNLRAEFQFIKALKECSGDVDIKSYINECLDLASDSIDYKTIKESNDKLKEVMVKYGMRPSNLISEEDLKFYDICNTVLTKKKKLSNIIEMKNNVNELSSYVDSHKKDIVNESKSIDIVKMVDDYERKYNNLLSEEEKSFVKELIDAKQGYVDDKKKKLFDKMRNECVDIVNKLIKESDGEVKENLLDVKEQLINKEFCQETLVKDMAKFLEIRDVLLDK